MHVKPSLDAPAWSARERSFVALAPWNGPDVNAQAETGQVAPRYHSPAASPTADGRSNPHSSLYGREAAPRYHSTRSSNSLSRLMTAGLSLYRRFNAARRLSVPAQ